MPLEQPRRRRLGEFRPRDQRIDLALRLDLRQRRRRLKGARGGAQQFIEHQLRSEEHTSELQSLMRISYAVFCLKKKTQSIYQTYTYIIDIHSTTSYTK